MAVPAPTDEAHKLRLLQATARPAFANERVQTNAAAQVVFKLKAAWRGGTTHLVLWLAQTVQWIVCASRRARDLRGRGLQACRRSRSCSGWLRWCHAPSCT